MKTKTLDYGEDHLVLYFLHYTKFKTGVNVLVVHSSLYTN